MWVIISSEPWIVHVFTITFAKQQPTRVSSTFQTRFDHVNTTSQTHRNVTPATPRSRSNHVPTTFRSRPDHVPTTSKPRLIHVSTTPKPPRNYVPTTFQPRLNPVQYTPFPFSAKFNRYYNCYFSSPTILRDNNTRLNHHNRDWQSSIIPTTTERHTGWLVICHFHHAKS